MGAGDPEQGEHMLAVNDVLIPWLPEPERRAATKLSFMDPFQMVRITHLTPEEHDLIMEATTAKDSDSMGQLQSCIVPFTTKQDFMHLRWYTSMTSKVMLCAQQPLMINPVRQPSLWCASCSQRRCQRGPMYPNHDATPSEYCLRASSVSRGAPP